MAPKTPTLKQHLDPGYVGRLEAERDRYKAALIELRGFVSSDEAYDVIDRALASGQEKP